MKQHRKKKKKYNAIFFKIFLSITVIFVFYCIWLFKDLNSLMNDKPTSKPSIVYSDSFFIKKNSIFSNLFLKERLEELNITLQETEEGIRFKIKNFQYPDAIVSADDPAKIPNNSTVQIVVKDDQIDSIFVNGEEKNSILLPPTIIARFASKDSTIREYLKLSEIPPKISKAIIAIEDQRFLEHFGFDPRSFLRAIYINLKSGSAAQGGSTLTMQLVKNLLSSREKTIFRKLREIVLAIAMELKYSKEEILEKYLNEIYFGQIGALEIHGVAEAARYFFGKNINQLSTSEIALIAGVIKGPAYYSPYRHLDRCLERRNLVLKKMRELKIITEKEYKQAIQTKPNLAAPLSGINKAPYFVDFVKAQILEDLENVIQNSDLSNAGLNIYTTLDIILQKHADLSVLKTVTDIEKNFKITDPLRIEGILISADSKSGFIRALVGGRSYQATTYNRALNMKRQVGSLFKPIAYLAAFIKGEDQNGKSYTPAYLIDDEPWKYTYDNQEWIPHNYEKTYRGRITLYEAFINSINIPMAKIAVDVGIKKIAELANQLGITSKLLEVPALSLGAIEVSPIEMLQVYSVFANQGEKTDLTAIKVVTDSQQKVLARYTPASIKVVDTKFISVLNSLLHAVTKEGTAKSMQSLGFTKTAFGKTGTTNFYRDSWFAGFSQGLTTITWIGYDSLDIDESKNKKLKIPTLTGAQAALPLWTLFYKNSFPSKHDFVTNQNLEGVSLLNINRKTGCITNQTDPSLTFQALFINGTEPQCRD